MTNDLEEIAITELDLIKRDYSEDNEGLHSRADQVLVDFLYRAGYSPLADKYMELRKIGFWYA